MEITQCSGTFTLRFENLHKEAELFDAISFAFNTPQAEVDYKHMALFDALYHATEGTCMLMYTYSAEPKRRVRFTCGKEGLYDHRRIAQILSMIAPYTAAGEITVYNEQINHRYVFNGEEGWVFEAGKVVYKKKALLSPIRSVA